MTKCNIVRVAGKQSLPKDAVLARSISEPIQSELALHITPLVSWALCLTRESNKERFENLCKKLNRETVFSHDEVLFRIHVFVSNCCNIGLSSDVIWDMLENHNVGALYGLYASTNITHLKEETK